MTKDDDSLVRYFEVVSQFPIERVVAGLSLSERFNQIAQNYRSYQKQVDAGLASWMHGDPYQIADWVTLFSPIEYDAWCEIRGYGAPLWPQLPVGKFFVDFGNPVAKIALECDGKEFHDPIKDRERDATLATMGWRVFRVTGAECYQTRVMDDPADHFGDDYEDYMEQYDAKTIVPVIREMKRILREHRQ
jgi:hypothetical protein